MVPGEGNRTHTLLPEPEFEKDAPRICLFSQCVTRVDADFARSLQNLASMLPPTVCVVGAPRLRGPVSRVTVDANFWRHTVALPAERMKAMRERRRARGLRELRLVVPDARSRTVRRRVARQVAGLDRTHELDAMRWIEAVSEFDSR
jgi:hypothetical protein